MRDGGKEGWREGEKGRGGEITNAQITALQLLIKKWRII
jgi:hypothetical protein